MIGRSRSLRLIGKLEIVSNESFAAYVGLKEQSKYLLVDVVSGSIHHDRGFDTD